jgi:hypothetical protein
LAGTGDAVPTFDIPLDAVAIARITHSGGGNFAVWTVSSSGSKELLVNVIGNYVGTVLFDDVGHSVAFEISAGGYWTVAIDPVSSAFSWDGATAVSGRGDDVFQIRPPTPTFSVSTLTHDGASNFAVWSYSPEGRDLLVNEIGPYSGEVLLAEATFLVVINADGNWTMTPPG